MVALKWRVVKNDFPSKPGAVKHAAASATLKSAQRIATDAQGRYSATPGDTGEMRDKTTARPTGALSAEAVSAAEHAIYQDQGTRYLPATHFFSDAADAEAATFGPEIAAEIGAALG